MPPSVLIAQHLTPSLNLNSKSENNSSSKDLLAQSTHERFSLIRYVNEHYTHCTLHKGRKRLLNLL
jgi:hypothetical protein